MGKQKSSSQRKFFSDIPHVLDLPDLVEIQKDSYKWFFDIGLRELFDEISPITDFIGRDMELYFGDYYLDEPKFDEVTARERDVTYEAAMRVTVKLVNKKTSEVKEQEVYIGDFPVMTERGTFVINGVERTVVSQLIRSAGVLFTSEKHRGKTYYGSKLIPNRGAWLEFDTDYYNTIGVKIDRKRRVPATSFLRALGMSEEEILNRFEKVDSNPEVKYIRSTLDRDAAKTEEESIREVYRRIRPGDLANIENARSLIHGMFFNFDRYDLDPVGRYKMNQRFNMDIENIPENRVLRIDDVCTIIEEIINLNNGIGIADDIDHLSNRRVRAVGEQVKNKLRIGLNRMERIVKDRMSTLDVNTITPNSLVNARPIIASVKEFFMSSQQSQFMTQINPLSELEHKRRLTATGPGGVTRERAGFEVRDVHRTHYGRICPIQTPEGPNIGLVGYLASYARVNHYGFIETPFRKVINKVANNGSDAAGHLAGKTYVDNAEKTIVEYRGKITEAIAKKLKSLKMDDVSVIPVVTDEIEYLDAIKTDKVTTTTATMPTDDDNRFVDDKLNARKNGKPELVSVTEIEYVDVAPNQIVSVATSLIPFLQNDDGTRALMGSNMQRQAVPCVRPEAPLVGTGIEKRAAIDSGQVAIAAESGEVIGVHGRSIVVKEKDNVRTYDLKKFNRSNESTSINQKPLVTIGDKVKKGDVIADGPSTEDGELAIGQNLTVAFMTWEGGNYEDAILLSERVVKDDRLSSVHIEDYTIDVRDTKLGPEMITRDIPNVGEEKIKHLDENGVIRIGAEVVAGDILVGKITPKGETELTAEEKLLRAIFGEKAKDVRDTSKYLDHGAYGKVVGIREFSRENGDKLPSGVLKSIKVSIAQFRRIQVGDKMAGRHGNKGVISRIVAESDMPFLPDGTPVDIILNPLGVVSRMNIGQLFETHLGIAAQKLGYKAAIPVLTHCSIERVQEELKKAGLPEEGKMTLYDGRTGEPFHRKVAVGVIYMLKLNHMIDDKMHQRSIGPYSLITQQPLGGKAQFGGQRFGEMEVWALEAYGAAHTLQEILTIKSDDVIGRSKAYESIIKSEPVKVLNIPESFNVLVRELKGLGLDVGLLKDGKPINISTKKKESQDDL